jgi:predicted nucleotidyltransferase component of viral defense system
MTKNRGASVLDKLKGLRKTKGGDVEHYLQRFVNEAFLRRLSSSEFKETFVLKGGNLFAIWEGADTPRPTSDVDLHSLSDDYSSDRVVDAFRRICEIPVDDGIQIDLSKMRVEKIREGFIPGVRISGIMRLNGAEKPIKVDVGFGDVITPAAQWVLFPSLIADIPPAEILAYPRESVIAEKVDGILQHGLTNTRMKDYYDIWFYSQKYEFEGDVLVRAFRATLQTRGRDIPVGEISGLSEEFVHLASRHWVNFLNRESLRESPRTLLDAVNEVRCFVLPVIEHLDRGFLFDVDWKPDGGWVGRGMDLSSERPVDDPDQLALKI